MTQLDHINVVVSNLIEAQDFFIMLGFKKGDSSNLSGEWISDIVGLKNVDASYVSLILPGSETAVELIQYHSHPPTSESDLGLASKLGLRHLAFSVEDIEATVSSLKGKGVNFLSDVHTYEKTGKKLVYFYGPDGILLELAQYKI